MPNNSDDHFDSDVAIVGAGPAGLMLAGDLASMGHSVTVYERRQKTESNLTRAFSVHARALEQLAIRGLADEIIDAGMTVSSIPLLGRLDITFARLATSFPFMLVVPQFVVEGALKQRAMAAGAIISYDTPVTGVSDSLDRVTLTTNPKGATASKLVHSRYVVGADGLRSTIRAQLGIDFPGEAVLESVIIADTKVAAPPPSDLAIEANGDGFAFICPIQDGYYRVLSWNTHTQPYVDDATDFRSLSNLCDKIFDRDVGLHSPGWISRFHSDERQATAYRQGNAFLIGDAAHIHSPAGGLGMNVGLQDAANLSWRLHAALVSETDLALEGYEAEMRPIGAQALRDSGNLVRGAKRLSTMPLPLRWAVMAAANYGGAPSRAYASNIAQSLSGIEARCGSSSDPGEVGRFLRAAPSMRQLHPTLIRGSFALLTPRETSATTQIRELKNVDVHVVPSAHTSQLIRPDGYIAWQGFQPTLEAVRAEMARNGIG